METTLVYWGHIGIMGLCNKHGHQKEIAAFLNGLDGFPCSFGRGKCLGDSGQLESRTMKQLAGKWQLC